MKKIITATLLICLLLSLFAACAEKPDELTPQRFSPGYAKALSATEPDGPDSEDSDSEDRAPVAVLSYDDVYAALTKYANAMDYGLRGAMVAGGAMPMPEMALMESDEAMSAPAAPPMPSSAPMEYPADAELKSPDYSETNVQVAGIDEGDIVKTDGKYIYVLRNNELIIFKADGAGTKQVSKTVVCKNEEDTAVPNNKNEYYYSYEYATEMYVHNGKLVVLTSFNDYSQLFRNNIYTYKDSQITKVYVYDVSDPAAPKLEAQLGQDGYMLTSRLIDGTLYLISTYYVYNPIEDDPGTFIPRVYAEGEATLFPRDCIAIMPYLSSTSYTIVCSYDLTEAKLAANQSVLGGGSTVYMNQKNLYIAANNTDTQESAPYRDSIYTVIDYAYKSVTDIMRFDVTDGGISFTGSCTVPGRLLNQFSMDEYNGFLRLVTTTYSSSYSVYSDEKMGWSNYVWREDLSANALYILDEAMSITGKIEDIAKDERVYSVRFDGDIGYFVTFRQVDPLFAVDLADPSAPKILSALKIPGFSDYLHVYGDGLLFGLGRNADENTGRTGSMKMSMFDTSDPADIFEKDKLMLDDYYSTALYNHKAILISPKKDIIAFPVENGYAIYGYSVESGFYRRALITDLAGYWFGDARGLYIDDFAYIVTNSRVSVLDMNGFKTVANIEF